MNLVKTEIGRTRHNAADLRKDEQGRFIIASKIVQVYGFQVNDYVSMVHDTDDIHDEYLYLQMSKVNVENCVRISKYNLHYNRFSAFKEKNGKYTYKLEGQIRIANVEYLKFKKDNEKHN